MPRITGFGRYAIPLACLCLSLPAAAEQEESRRVALIIGNASYSLRPLKNAVNDARLMDQALKTAGFKTTLIENASKDQMEEALGVFADKQIGRAHV